MVGKGRNGFPERSGAELPAIMGLSRSSLQLTESYYIIRVKILMDFLVKLWYNKKK